MRRKRLIFRAKFDSKQLPNEEDNKARVVTKIAAAKGGAAAWQLKHNDNISEPATLRKVPVYF